MSKVGRILVAGMVVLVGVLGVFGARNEAWAADWVVADASLPDGNLVGPTKNQAKCSDFGVGDAATWVVVRAGIIGGIVTVLALVVFGAVKLVRLVRKRRGVAKCAEHSMRSGSHSVQDVSRDASRDDERSDEGGMLKNDGAGGNRGE